MTIRKTIKVLVVDDSLLFRETLAKEIDKDLDINVICKASDPYEARDMIIKYKPDVLTLDVQMPKMNGIEFLRKLLPQYPIPVVVVSSVSDNVFNALEAGAVDFVAKPTANNPNNFKHFINELVTKVKIASTVKVGHLKRTPLNPPLTTNNISVTSKSTIIAIGASTGGTDALYNIIKELPKEMPPIVVVQHMPPKFTKMYADRLNNTCALEVYEAKDGDSLRPGCVLIAPGDYHMKLKKLGSTYKVQCFKGERVNGHSPSVDVLFNSVALLAGKNAIGVILTGMGYDGAKGLLAMRKTGAKTYGQDENSCVVYGMPKVAFNISAVEKELPLDKIASALCNSLRKM